MNEYTTAKGTKLYWHVSYNLGGYNQFNNKLEPRCYDLVVQRNPQELAVFEDLDYPTGSTRLVLNEVSRRSKKQERIANELALEKLQAIEQHYNL